MEEEGGTNPAVPPLEEEDEDVDEGYPRVAVVAYAVDPIGLSVGCFVV